MGEMEAGDMPERQIEEMLRRSNIGLSLRDFNRLDP